MKKYGITAEEFEKVSLERIATSPGANSAYGESRMKGVDLKRRMNEPLRMFCDKFNALIELISGNDRGDELAAHMPTGIFEDHTFADLVRDIVSEGAEFAAYLSVGEQTLLEVLLEYRTTLDEYIEHEKLINPHKVTAAQVGLGNVDNTADEDKPLSSAARKALKSLSDEINNLISALSDMVAERYVGKSGEQVIDGSLTVKTLMVEESAYGMDIESLNVKDRFICANSDGVPLAGLTGIVIRVSSTAAYGIVHDTTGNCVKIGLGVYDTNAGVFTFNDGEAQAIATRGEIANNHIPVWNNEKNCLEDSGKSIEDLAASDFKNNLSNALKGSKSGEAVVLSDISPVEHELSVKVSNVEDSESVKLLAQGANLLRFENYTTYAPTGCSFETIENGFIVKNDGSTEWGYVAFTMEATREICGKTLYLSYLVTDRIGNFKGTPNNIGETDIEYYSNGSRIYKLAISNGGGAFEAPPYEEGMTIRILLKVYPDMTLGGAISATYSNIMISLKGGIAYEPYIEPIEYEQGEVIKSISPTTTIFTDTPGAVLEVTYNRDINKAFDELTNVIISLGGII